MALHYTNGVAGNGSLNIFGKSSFTHTAYGKLGSDEPTIGLNELLEKITNPGYSKDLEILYENIGEELEGILLKYSLGKFDEMKEELTDNRYDEINEELNRQNVQIANPFFEIYKTLFRNVLAGLKNTVKQYVEHLDTIQKLEVAQEKANILDNPLSLQQFYQERFIDGNYYLFDLPDITTTAASISPEIQEYIKLYGVPENLEFDETKLTNIKIKLNLI